MIRHIRTAEFDRMKEFYLNQIRPSQLFVADDQITFKDFGAEIYIERVTSPANAGVDEVLRFACTDVKGVCEMLSERGVRIRSRDTTNGPEVFIVDPDNNRILLTEGIGRP